MQNKNKNNVKIEDILLFLNRFDKEKFNLNTEKIPPSMFFTHKWKTLINKKQVWHIVNDTTLRNFIILIKLFNENFLNIDIFSYKIKDEWLRRLFKQYEINNNFSWITLIDRNSFYKPTLLERIFWIKKHKVKIKTKVDLKALLEIHFDYFLQNITYLDDFLMEVYTSFSFLEWILFFIEDNQNKTNFNKQLNAFYKHIQEQIWNRENYINSVCFSFKIEDYIKNYWYFFKIADKLEENWILKIKDVFIKDNYITFELEKINKFHKENILKLFYNSESLEYIKWDFYIFWEKILFRNKKDKIYNIYKLIFDYFSENNVNKVSLWDLEEYYKNNKNNYNSPKNFKVDYEYFRKSLDEKNKEIQEKFNLDNTFIGINTKAIQCVYFNTES